MSFAFWTVADTVRHVAAGEVTAVQITETMLARIGAIDDELGAYLAIDGDGARAAAADVDRRRAANLPIGPLAGVPIALKDVLVTRG
ncbi:MAG TPA: amidase family protein, partial [Kofleriaceae bacterium]|nr:amidase family protein [Kofleriaceae bacterium]